MSKEFYDFARDFFGTGKAEKTTVTYGVKASRRCRKCGGSLCSLKYFAPADRIDVECQTCGFAWHEQPLDKGRDP